MLPETKAVLYDEVSSACGGKSKASAKEWITVSSHIQFMSNVNVPSIKFYMRTPGSQRGPAVKPRPFSCDELGIGVFAKSSSEFVRMHEPIDQKRIHK